METVKSRNGQSIIKLNGKHLCSSVDPIKEAQSWVESHKKQLSSIEAVIIIGVGAGYHIVELRRTFPAIKILAFDLHAEMIEFARREHALDLVDVDFQTINKVDAQVISKLDEINKSQKLKSLLLRPYTVLKFHSATMHQAQFYNELFLFLLARTESGFCFLMSVRSELASVFEMSKIREVEVSLFSIKTLERLLIRSEEKHSTLLFLALREMVN